MVMMRDFVRRKARKLGLVGFVRNMSDGSVEAYAVGTKGNLEKWIAYLHKGPLLAHIERVEAQWGIEPPSDMSQKSFDSFDIVF